MSNVFIYDGTTWVDPCKCNIAINDVNNEFQYVDPNTCEVYIYNGTTWCLITCDCTCADGYDKIGENCFKRYLFPADFNGCSFNIVKPFLDLEFSKYSNLYSSLSTTLTYPVVGYSNAGTYTLRDNNGAGTNLVITNSLTTVTNSLWTSNNGAISRLNVASIWAANSNTSSNLADGIYLPISFCIQNSSEFEYLLAVGCNNGAQIFLTSTSFNGGVTNQLLVDLRSSTSAGGVFVNTVNDVYRGWHIFPIKLPAGTHTITFKGKKDTSSLTTAAIAAEIYDISASNFVSLLFNTTAVESDLEPYLLYSTKRLVTTPALRMIDPTVTSPVSYSCAPGYIQTNCEGVPCCIKDDNYNCDNTPTVPSAPPTTRPTALACSQTISTTAAPLTSRYFGMVVPSNIALVQFNISLPGGVNNGTGGAVAMQILSEDRCYKYSDTGFFGADIIPTGNFMFNSFTWQSGSFVPEASQSLTIAATQSLPDTNPAQSYKSASTSASATTSFLNASGANTFIWVRLLIDASVPPPNPLNFGIDITASCQSQ